MEIEKITDNNVILAIVARAENWHKFKGLDFITKDQDFVQVGFWNYNKGQNLSNHIHLENPKESLKTQEVIFIKSGSLRADIFNQNEKFLASVILKQGDTAVFFNGGHGYEILENETQVLEVKNGPYLGPELDRKRIL